MSKWSLLAPVSLGVLIVGIVVTVEGILSTEPNAILTGSVSIAVGILIGLVYFYQTRGDRTNSAN